MEGKGAGGPTGRHNSDRISSAREIRSVDAVRSQVQTAFSGVASEIQTLVEAGEVTKIIPAQNMSGQTLPLSTKRVFKGEDHFITQVMPLKYLDAKGLQPIADRLQARDTAVFGGVADMGKFNFFERMVGRALKTPPGDYRDWDAITAWAKNIAGELKK